MIATAQALEGPRVGIYRRERRGKRLRAELHWPDNEMRRFMIYLAQDALKLNYPPMAAFARGIAAGTINLPPPEKEDPVMELVSRFYNTRLQIERLMLINRYMSGLTIHEQANAVGVSIGRLNRKIEKLLMVLREQWLESPQMVSEKG